MNVSYALQYVSNILIVRFLMDCATGCELDSIRRSPDCRLASCGLTGGLLSKTAEHGTLIGHFQVPNTITFKMRLRAKQCSRLETGLASMTQQRWLPDPMKDIYKCY